MDLLMEGSHDLGWFRLDCLSLEGDGGGSIGSGSSGRGRVASDSGKGHGCSRGSRSGLGSRSVRNNDSFVVRFKGHVLSGKKTR